MAATPGPVGSCRYLLLGELPKTGTAARPASRAMLVKENPAAAGFPVAILAGRPTAATIRSAAIIAAAQRQARNLVSTAGCYHRKYGARRRAAWYSARASAAAPLRRSARASW